MTATKLNSQQINNYETGWILANETWTYVSVDDPTGVFKVNANVTTKYSAGMRIKMTNGGNTIYGIITAVGTYGGTEAGYTYITFLHEIDPTDSLALYLMANSAITVNYYSSQKSPYGFPLETNKWTVYKVDSTNRSQSSPTGGTWYNLGSISIPIPIGNWNVDYKVMAQNGPGSTYDRYINVTLSTTNNGNTNSNFLSSSAFPSTMSFVRQMGNGKDNITLTSKTSYYLNMMSDILVDILYFRNAENTAIIKAVCAYL